MNIIHLEVGGFSCEEFKDLLPFLEWILMQLTSACMGGLREKILFGLLEIVKYRILIFSRHMACEL